MRRVVRSGVEVGDISAVFITHLHYDHAVSLPELFNMFGRRRADPPRVFGPSGIAEYVENCKKLIIANGLNGLTESLQQLHGEQITPGEKYEVPGFLADAIEVPHDPLIQALAWRFRSGDTTVVVSGDLVTGEELMAPFASGADLLIHESYSNEALETFVSNFSQPERQARIRKSFSSTHSEISTVAKVAEKAQVNRLALTALLASENENRLINTASKHYGGEVFAAQAGESLEI